MVNEVRGKILEVLRSGLDCMSGELISQELGISRVSVWKHIRSLQQEGYAIEASPKGYHLISSPDLLLPYEFPGWERKIRHFDTIGSTMDVAQKLAREGVEEGTAVIAEAQLSGKGRLGRGWLSPKGGIYFTIVLRPNMHPAFATRVNLMASVAVAKTIRKLFNLKAELKWPNDVLVRGRKVCGILAEMDAEVDRVNFINVGIGINANTPISACERNGTSLKEELGREIQRREFVSALLTEIEKQQRLPTVGDSLRQWRNLSLTLNRDVRIVAQEGEILGKAIDIDVTGALVLRAKDGSLRNVYAGDCIHST